MDREERLGWLAGLGALACWSGFILVSRSGGQSPLTPFDIMALRFVVGGVCLLFFFRPRRFWLNWRGLALALTGGIGYCLMVYQGFRHTSAVHAAVMLPGLIPFGAALFSYALLGDRPPIFRIVGLLLIATGGTLMLSAINDSASLQGDLWLVGAVLAWSLYSVLARRWQVPVMTGAITTGIGSALLYLPVYFFLLPKQVQQAPLEDIVLQSVYQGVIATVIAMLLYLRAVSAIGPAAMGALMALVPVLSGLAAVPVLGEVLADRELLALAVTSAGALLASGLLRRPAPAVVRP